MQNITQKYIEELKEKYPLNTFLGETKKEIESLIEHALTAHAKESNLKLLDTMQKFCDVDENERGRLLVEYFRNLIQR